MYRRYFKTHKPVSITSSLDHQGWRTSPLRIPITTPILSIISWNLDPAKELLNWIETHMRQGPSQSTLYKGTTVLLPLTLSAQQAEPISLSPQTNHHSQPTEAYKRPGPVNSLSRPLTTF